MLSDVGGVVAAPEAEHDLDADADDAGGDSMAQRDYVAIRDRPDVLDCIQKTLRELDVPPTQVLVEPTILAVTLEEDNALGVDFTLVGGVDLELLGAVSNAGQLTRDLASWETERNAAKAKVNWPIRRRGLRNVRLAKTRRETVPSATTVQNVPAGSTGSRVTYGESTCGSRRRSSACRVSWTATSIASTA
jgi:hypothetical protein